MTDILRVRAVGTGWAGGPGLWTSYFQGSASPTAAEALEAAKRVRAFFASYVLRIPNNNSWDVSELVDVLDIDSGTLTGGFGVATQAIVNGTGSGFTAPIASAILLSNNTGAVVAGRRLTGRHFLAPTLTGSYDGVGGVQASTSTDLLTAAALLRTLITTAVSEVVWHRPKGPKGQPKTGGLVAVVTSDTVATKPAVLRSRRD